MYSNADFKRLEEFLEKALELAPEIYPTNAETLYNYSVDDDFIIAEFLFFNRYYLNKLIKLCNPSFSMLANEKKIMDICEDYITEPYQSDYWIKMWFTPHQLIQLIDFVQGKGSQTNLF